MGGLTLFSPPMVTAESSIVVVPVLVVISSMSATSVIGYIRAPNVILVPPVHHPAPTLSLPNPDLPTPVRLKPNDKKTEALWIGANCSNEEISLPGRNFKWPKHKVKALGVWHSVDPEATATLNYNEKLDKIRNILSSCKYRILTLIGKIAVLKSLVASQLDYVLSPLRTNAKAIKEVNKLFFSFLWNDKGDKIKRDIMINDYSNGGLKMLDIECVVPENIHTPPQKVTGNSEGEGGSKAEISEGSGGFIGSSFSRG